MGPTTQAVVFQMTPILGALIGIVTTLIIVAVVIIFIVRTRDRDDVSGAQLVTSNQPGQTDMCGSKAEASVETTSASVQEEERCPAVVPSKIGIRFCII